MSVPVEAKCLGGVVCLLRCVLCMTGVSEATRRWKTSVASGKDCCWILSNAQLE